jgi:NAD(P)-dependent dehydrogenase (short-subunit alcohol dehydrogenase family)
VILDRFRLDGRLALVTGGTGRYGLPFARALAEAGAHVVITSRSAAAAGQTAAQLVADGLSASGAELDLGDEGSIAKLKATLTEHGRLDVLVNNAVHRQGGDPVNTTAADWDATSRVNSRGLFLLTRELVPLLIERGNAAIVNIGSIYGEVGPDFAIYRGTSMTTPPFYAYDKAGLSGLTRYLATWLGPHGVRVNCLAPGGLYDGTQPEAFVGEYVARVPLGRMAREDDVTGALLLLASDAGAYITGTTLLVDGGWTAH